MWVPHGPSIRRPRAYAYRIRPYRGTIRHVIYPSRNSIRRLTFDNPLILYHHVYLNRPVNPNFILFSCPFTSWVRHLLSWTDPWSDGLTQPLGNVL